MRYLYYILLYRCGRLHRIVVLIGVPRYNLYGHGII